MKKYDGETKEQISIKIQLKYTIKLLQNIFGRYNKITNQMIQLIMDFLFASPFIRKNIFVLKQGKLIICIHQNNQPKKQPIIVHNNQAQFIQIQKSLNINPLKYKTIRVNNSTPLKEQTHYILGNKFNHNQKIHVTKIWPKPPTRTEKKILTYCGKFKQFLLGKHLAHKTIDIRFLKRQFYIPFHQLQQFQKHFNNIKQNDVNFCSFDVIDSYMALVTKNWIQLQFQSNQITDKQQKIYKVIPQGYDDLQILTGIFVRFQQLHKKWYLKGVNLNIWQQKNLWSRNQTLIRTIDGNVYLTEGSISKKIDSVQFFNQ